MSVPQGELYLAMGRLIMACIVILAVLVAVWLLLEYGAERAQERAQAAVARRRCSLRRIAKKHGRVVREDKHAA